MYGSMVDIQSATAEIRRGKKKKKLEMWVNAQRDGRPADYRRRPLFNAAKFGWRPLLECRAVTLPRRDQQQPQPFYSPLSGTTRVIRYQKRHSPTHHLDHHPICPDAKPVEICWGAPNAPTVLSRYWAEVHHIMRTCGGGIIV